MKQTGNQTTSPFINTAGIPASMVIAPIASVAVIGAGLLLYLKKRNY